MANQEQQVVNIDGSGTDPVVIDVGGLRICVWKGGVPADPAEPSPHGKEALAPPVILHESEIPDLNAQFMYPSALGPELGVDEGSIPLESPQAVQVLRLRYFDGVVLYIHVLQNRR